MTLRRIALALFAALFISALTFGPGLVSAKRSDDERSLKSKTEKTEKSASAECSEGDKQSDRTAKKRQTEPRGNLARVAGFIRKLFTGDDKAEEQRAEALDDSEENDDDVPPFMHGRINRQDYLNARQEWVNLKLGMTPGLTYDPTIRSRAIDQMTAQREALQAQARKIERGGSGNKIIPNIASNVWTELGPKPAPNGQTSTVNQPVSGRTVAIAIHPTNPNIVYVGGAQAGVYRSTNGGQTWTPIFDGAQSLVIGALALAPSNPDILYVGTGEAGQCLSGCYAGIGVYRIDNASTTANLTGPINPLRNYNDASNVPTSGNIFTGRAISKILVNPTDPSIIFVATATGIVGNPQQGNTVPPLGIRGIYRLANATGAPAGVTQTKLTVSATNCFDTPCTGNLSILDMVFDGNDGTGNTLVCWLRPTTGVEGGVYRTTNAQTTATFTNQLLQTSTTNTRGELASVTIAGTTTMYLANGESTNGRVRRSTDGGVTWSAALGGGQNFCTGQCFYDISIAIDPTNANIAYLGGAAGTNIMRKTTDGFATAVNTPSRQVGLPDAGVNFPRDSECTEQQRCV